MEKNLMEKTFFPRPEKVFFQGGGVVLKVE